MTCDFCKLEKITVQSAGIRQAISSLGCQMGPDVLNTLDQLFRDEQQNLINTVSATATDLAYGPHERQVLDIYCPPQTDNSKPRPVVLFIHGGGFLKGDKGSDQNWANANVGRMLASRNMIGVVMNYRLAPEFTWPSGGEDTGLAIQWLRQHIADYGGDPDQLFAIGTSAGAVHLATWVQLNTGSSLLRGMIFLSGLYGITELDPRDTLYYGAAELYVKRRPLEALVSCDIPQMYACSEFDPPRFQHEFLGMTQRILTGRGNLPCSMIVSGHNHYSITRHLGTSDQRLADEIIGFIDQTLQQAETAPAANSESGA